MNTRTAEAKSGSVEQLNHKETIKPRYNMYRQNGWSVSETFYFILAKNPSFNKSSFIFFSYIVPSVVTS